MIYFFSATTFLSSFLLFTIQLLVGKKILPWFGGVAQVWTATMLFFMTVLFFGYLYVNLLSRFKKSTQIKIHLYLVLLALAGSFFNLIFYHSLILPNPNWTIFQYLSPTIHILILILVSVGLPYFLLSTTSTLLQYWFAKINPKKSPYSLYVTSNIGSLLGLLAYPLILEPIFTLSSQELLWFAFFLIYLGLVLYICKLFSKFSLQTVTQKISTTALHFSAYIPWLALSTISNIALLATTSQITQSISPIPFLWILPLTIFLVTFIIAFSGDKWYSRSLHGSLLLFSVIFTTLVFSGYIHLLYKQQLGVVLFTLFMTNLVCHAELWRSRPVSNYLVPFYLTISLGGVIASLFCAVISPYLFPDLWEFSIYLFLGLLVYLIITLNESENLWQGFQYLTLCILVAVFMLFRFQFVYGKGFVQSNDENQVLKSRNFYGVLRVIDSGKQSEDPIRRLINGGILHGYQPLNKNIFNPTSYYSLDSGVGQIVSKNDKRLLKHPLRVGVIGLGAGTMAAYCEPGDYFRFYEINEDAIDVSQRYFSYLSHCKDMSGSVDLVKGDARVSLQQELAADTAQSFDVLVVDAFTDDAIPVHLLTQESIKIYLSHMASEGVIAFHISNSFLNLDLILDKEVDSLGLYSARYQTQQSFWYFVSRSQLNTPIVFSKPKPNKKIRLWTDNYSNILQILR